MIKIKIFGVIIAIILLLSSCSSVSVKKEANNTKTVDDVLNEQIKAAEGSKDAQSILDDGTVDDQIQAIVEEIADSVGIEEFNAGFIVPESDTIGFDYISEDYIDLTTLNKDMVYAMVYQMMVDPETFMNKEIKMKGLFSVYYDENTKTNYFAILIEDALACCASGIEFIWDDGSHVYPDDYPEVGSVIMVTGIFETYIEEGNSNEYLRLRDCTLELSSP
ncbi:MAG: hypothetical protein CVU95_08880 [Firmicutes bacterium HGW-Firmicutes-2]|jgi:hypothetical protein|nr:MAG: hypothetical protein CVU95_08880 [Firmicutes bacterium HGW-Firmicutes-2]